VCPVGIDLPGLLLNLRADEAVRRRQPAWLRAAIRGFRAVATHPAAYRTATRIGRMGLALGSHGGWVRRLPGPLAAWTDHRDFPVMARRSFQEEWNEKRRPGRGARDQGWDQGSGIRGQGSGIRDED